MSKELRASNLTCSKKILLVDWMDNKHPNVVLRAQKSTGGVR